MDDDQPLEPIDPEETRLRRVLAGWGCSSLEQLEQREARLLLLSEPREA